MVRAKICWLLPLSIHLSKKSSSEKRRLAKFHLFSSTKLSFLLHELDNSNELDKVSLLPSFYSLNTNDYFKLFNQFCGTIPISFIIHYDSSTADDAKGKADLFNTFLLSALKPESFVFHKYGISVIPLSHSLKRTLLFCYMMYQILQQWQLMALRHLC